MTRTHTPPHHNPVTGTTRINVQRACNRCGRNLGDATEKELDACVNGAPLPDVHDECGCDASLAEPAEEHTKAEREFPADAFGEVVRIGWATYYFGADNEWHNARTGAIETREDLIKEARSANGDWYRLVPETSSPVVPAPTEAEWPTWQEVPEGVWYVSRDLKMHNRYINRNGNRYNDAGDRGAADLPGYMSPFAPFVAAKEQN